MRWFLLLLLFGATACEGIVIDAPERGTPAPTAEASASARIAPTAASEGGASLAALRAADARTRSAPTYRGTFSFTTTVTNGAEVRSDTFLAYEATVQGDDSQVIYVGGAFNEILGGGERIEVVNTEQKSYIRGASLFGTVEPERWYVFPESRMSGLPLDSGHILQITGEDFAHARAGAVIALDSQTCVVWDSDIRTGAGNLVEWLIGRAASGAPHTVEAAEAHYAVCQDGYVHQMEWEIAARNSDGADERTGILVRARRFAFGAADIRIVAPQGAIEIR